MKIKRILITLCRVLLGAMFIFSGFTKGVDPMGTAIKFGEYFTAFGMDFMQGSQMFFSIAISTGEIVLGFMLLFGIMPRMTSLVASVSMVLLTLFTLFVALTDPVAECGCFGDVLVLTNWQSFMKNVFLLMPLSIIVMANSWIMQRRKNSVIDIAAIAVVAIATINLSIHCLRHLPLFDFLPYKVGVNLTEALWPKLEEDDTRLLYRDKLNGQTREFPISDTTWYDTTRWQYVETIVSPHRQQQSGGASMFAIMNGSEDVTMSLLNDSHVLFLLCVSDPAGMSTDQSRTLLSAAQQAKTQGYAVAGITPVRTQVGKKHLITVDQSSTVEFYNIDDVTLKSLLRSPYGLVVLRDGVIVDKMAWRDIPAPGHFTDYAD